ncbi:MAG: ACT domain-containing protein [Metallibacterium scheffleri]|jgi:acetolactate synthase regulatory subunit|uniref:ACT domain-containing protein n=1 Tax=Metallibacterium scheffleri TaxID=993689 RepID=UPI0026EE6C13|nr:ACT domain-containing protein [Metallibacterium scheffleri]MCK9367044.1 ACT domain-containing protein [Metallibacterium scheffleri]HVB84586.1 ACT domain-containing protein [Rhodanobacteraceae bacterium]
MIQRLHVTLLDVEGALQRLLGTAERRGFHVLQLHAEVGAGDLCTVALTLEGTRDAALLRRQLERLHEVRDVSLAAD